MNGAKFDTIHDGKSIQLYHISSKSLSCYITNYGARVVSISTLDRHKNKVDVVLGFDSIQAYFSASEQYHGATVGRFANRIANGNFQLNGTTYTLTKNNGPNSLHGGEKGFHNQVWECISSSESCVILQLVSPHLDEGFPGELTTKVTYKVEGSVLKIDYQATTTRDTVINLTHHSYFNLNGEGSGSILDHQLQLNAEYYTPVDTNLIPKGSIEMVTDTPFDFTKQKRIGENIDDDHQQLRIGGGYDHNFVVNHYEVGHINLVGKVIGDTSGIMMEVWSTEPGVQFYSANNLDGQDTGKSGRNYHPRTAFCLETQHFPDSPNQLHFPSTLLSVNQEFKSSTEYRFYIYQA